MVNQRDCSSNLNPDELKFQHIFLRVTERHGCTKGYSQTHTARLQRKTPPEALGCLGIKGESSE